MLGTTRVLFHKPVLARQARGRSCGTRPSESASPYSIATSARSRALPDFSMIPGSRANAATHRPLNSADQALLGSANCSGCAMRASVRVNLGQNETTATLCGRSSSAVLSVSMSTAALTTLYDTLPVYLMAPIDEMLTIRPVRRGTIIRAAHALAM